LSSLLALLEVTVTIVIGGTGLCEGSKR